MFVCMSGGILGVLMSILIKDSSADVALLEGYEKKLSKITVSLDPRDGSMNT